MSKLKSNETMRHNIYAVVRLFAGNLVHVVTTYSLGGSHANKHHTPSPTQGRCKNQPQMRVQVTRNLLELPFAAPTGNRHKNPSQSPFDDIGIFTKAPVSVQAFL